jgi:hypothetical protein
VTEPTDRSSIGDRKAQRDRQNGDRTHPAIRQRAATMRPIWRRITQRTSRP